MTLASRVVLIIEDEPQIRRVLRTLLEERYEPRRAAADVGG